MMAMRRLLLGAVVLLASGCQPTSAKFDPEDAKELAAIDSAVSAVVAGAHAVDADKVLAIAEGPAEFTFITGDVLLGGLEPIRESFRATYAGLERQDHEILSRRVRLIAPDVALFTAVGEGTYTDKAGWTSDTVGLGMTMVLAKRDGKWQAVHVHQSVAP